MQDPFRASNAPDCRLTASLSKPSGSYSAGTPCGSIAEDAREDCVDVAQLDFGIDGGAYLADG
jgi:hypothetical protein